MVERKSAGIDSLTDAELDAAKTRLVQQIRGLEDDIDLIEAELERRRQFADAERVQAQIARLVAGLPPEARSAAIAGASASLNADASRGEV